jgi:hypothetical protein
VDTARLKFDLKDPTHDGWGWRDGLELCVVEPAVVRVRVLVVYNKVIGHYCP